MKSLLSICVLCGLVVVLVVNSGCDLVTPPPGVSPKPVGNDLIISEVFTISPDKYYAYSWIEIYNPTPRTIPVLDFTYPASMYMLSAGGTVLKTVDDGRHWNPEPVTLPSTSSINGKQITYMSQSYSYDNVGFAVGDNGAIIQYVWIDSTGQYIVNDQSSNVPLAARGRTFHQIAMTAGFPFGYIVGDSATILKTFDNGDHWRLPTKTVPTKQNLHAIASPNITTLYAVGDSSTILRSEESDVWLTRIPPPAHLGANYYWVGFISDTGWIVGENGCIAFSSNAGKLWQAQQTPTKATLRSAFFSGEAGFDGRMGWAVGDSGVILFTHDKGTHWTIQYSGDYTLRGVKFVDSLRGWAFGDDGTILLTTNAGTTWRVQSSGTKQSLRGAYPLPLLIADFHFYQLTMRGQRRYFFLDSATGVTNFNVITKVDTGIINFLTIGTTGNLSVPPGGFLIVNSDSIKFKDHSTLGPGNVQVLNYSVGFDTVWVGRTPTGQPIPQLIQPRNPILWVLPTVGEIRLERKSIRLTRAGDYLGSPSSTVVDVVRWGYFRPAPSDFPGEDTYPENEPAGYIPEWYSLARYNDDAGGSDPNKPATLSTSQSFFMAQTPIPGWFSQKRKP